MPESSDAKADLETLLQRRAANRDRIAIAIGTFPLIHAGAVRFLRRARSQCDSLFAAILPDSGLKTALARSELLRPDERRRVLAAMREVEAAGFVGDEGLPLSEWARLAPSARWVFSGAEKDVPSEILAELRRLGVELTEDAADEDCTAAALLERMVGK